VSTISESRENQSLYASDSLSQYKHDKTNGKLYYYEGSYQMVFTDSTNGNKEYIYSKNGKKVYLDEIAILKFKDDKQEQQQKLMSSLDEQEERYENQKQIWHQKFKLECQKYNIFRHAKETATKGYQNILRQTGCSKLSDIKAFDQANGGNFFERAKVFLTQRSDATAGIISSESMSAFYGRMFVDEASNVNDIKCQKIIANSIFQS